MDNTEYKFYTLLEKYKNNKQYKKVFFDLIYIHHIIEHKELLNMDIDEFNQHLYNAGSLIEENEILTKDDKEIIHNFICDNLLL